ncbi:MAG: hypothetical protein R3F56_01900 [Planctomycetota bacterium]
MLAPFACPGAGVGGRRVVRAAPLGTRSAPSKPAPSKLAPSKLAPSKPARSRLPLSALGLSVLALSGLALSACTQWLFSGVQRLSNDRPVMRIETRGGSEAGIGTDDGILFLGRTAQEGPCRIHYWLGLTPVIEDGVVERWGGIFFRARMDLRHQHVPYLDRDLEPDETLVAMLTDGPTFVEIPLVRAHGAQIEGDAVDWPGRELPAGTGVFARTDGGLRVVGMIAGSIEVGDQRYLVHTGTTALREALLTARPQREPRRVEHRPDDITIDK